MGDSFRNKILRKWYKECRLWWNTPHGTPIPEYPFTYQNLYTTRPNWWNNYFHTRKTRRQVKGKLRKVEVYLDEETGIYYTKDLILRDGKKPYIYPD